MVTSANPFSAYARGRPGLEDSFPSSVANVAAYDIAQRLAGRKAGQVGLGAGRVAASVVGAAAAAPQSGPPPAVPPAVQSLSTLGAISNSWISVRRVDPALSLPAPPQVTRVSRPPATDDESVAGSSPPPASRKFGRLRKAVDAKPPPAAARAQRKTKAVVVLSSDDEKGDDEEAAALLERVSAAAAARRRSGSPAGDSGGDDFDPSRDALLEQLGPEVAAALRLARAPADVVERFVDLHRVAKAAHNQLAASAVPAATAEPCSGDDPVGGGGMPSAGRTGSIWTPEMLYSAFGWHVGRPMTKPLDTDNNGGAPRSTAALSLTRYQLIGVNWLNHLFQAGINGILADDMGKWRKWSRLAPSALASLLTSAAGLGKTVQVCALLRVLSSAQGSEHPGPFLVVAPASTLGNWEAELRRWAPSLRVAVFRAAGASQLTFHHELMHGSRRQRAGVTTAAAAASAAGEVPRSDTSEADENDSESGTSNDSGSGDDEDDDGDGDASEASKDEALGIRRAGSGHGGSGSRRPAAGLQTQTSNCSAGSGAGASATPRAFDVLLTTYTLFDRSTESSRLDRAFLRRYRYQAIVLDEGAYGDNYFA